MVYIITVLVLYCVQDADVKLFDYQLCSSNYAGEIELRKEGKGSPYSITERRVPDLIPVLGSQPAGHVSHKPGGRLPYFFLPGPQLPPQVATLRRAATNFAV